MTHGKNWRSALAAAATAALMLTAVPGAMADTTKVVTGFDIDASKLDIAAIERGKTVDLTIIKKVDEAPVENVKFEVRRLDGFDLDSVDNWAKALELTPDQAKKGPFVGEPVIITTGANGEAKASDLARGVYLVTELESAASGSFVSSAPFVITLPTGDEKGERWNYDVKVVAKNQPAPAPSTPPTVPSVPNTPPVTKVPPVIPIPVPVPVPPKTTTVTPPVETTTTTTPVQVPEKPSVPEKGITRRVQQTLASTGASVIGVVIAGAALVIGGIFLVGRRRKTDEA